MHACTTVHLHITSVADACRHVRRSLLSHAFRTQSHETRSEPCRRLLWLLQSQQESTATAEGSATLDAPQNPNIPQPEPMDPFRGPSNHRTMLLRKRVLPKPADKRSITCKGSPLTFRGPQRVGWNKNALSFYVNMFICTNIYIFII